MIRRISSWRRRVVKFLRLGWAERVILIESLWLLRAIHRSLPRQGLMRTKMKYLPVSISRRLKTIPPDRIAMLVEWAARYGHQSPNCLVRSLVLQRQLHRCGRPGILRIGTRIIEGRFEAHAWIELDGRVINDDPDVGHRFMAFDQPVEPPLEDFL